MARVTKPSVSPVSSRHGSHVVCMCIMLVRNCPFFGQPGSGRGSVILMTSHESERDFGALTQLFSVAPQSGVQLENSGVMLPKFRSDSIGSS